MMGSTLNLKIWLYKWIKLRNVTLCTRLWAPGPIISLESLLNSLNYPIKILHFSNLCMIIHTLRLWILFKNINRNKQEQLKTQWHLIDCVNLILYLIYSKNASAIQQINRSIFILPSCTLQALLVLWVMAIKSTSLPENLSWLTFVVTYTCLIGMKK
jgi:hypothetical protein